MQATISGTEVEQRGAPTDATPAVAIIGITKRFGTTVAVDDVSLHIGRNEFFSILGPSGCGKTTLMRIITGFETPSEGRVELDGADVTHTPPHKRDLNMLFQSYALFPHLSVFGNVAFELRSRKRPRTEIRDRVRAALELVRLDGFEARKPGQLSGGQRQRVALARAVVARPAVVLLDEPLGALDLKLRQEMQLELKRMQREVGITFIYVTHDQEEALTMSDRIAVMSQGRVLQVDRPQQIYDHPATRFVAEFIGRSTLLTGDITSDSRNLNVDGIGDLPLPAPAKPAAGQATLVLRPERVTIQRATEPKPPGDAVVRLAATITDVVFLGGDTRIHARLANGQEILGRPSSDSPPHTAGEQVWATWRIQDACTLID